MVGTSNYRRNAFLGREEQFSRLGGNFLQTFFSQSGSNVFLLVSLLSYSSDDSGKLNFGLSVSNDGNNDDGDDDDDDATLNKHVLFQQL